MDALWLIVVAAINGVVASVIYRRTMAHGREPSLWHAAGVALANALVMTLAAVGPDVVSGRFWVIHRKTTPMEWLAAVGLGFTICAIIGFFAAAAVMLYYQWEFDE